MKKINSIGLSVATAILIGMTGCTDSTNDDLVENLEQEKLTDNIDTEKQGETTQPSKVKGKAVDGYLRYATVCLDLSADKFCQPTEPFTLTDINGSFEFEITADQKNSPEYKNAMLLVYGGQDSDRPGEDFIGKLEAPNDENGSINITPITSLVSAYIRNNDTNISSETIEKAKKKVAAILGLSLEQIDSDPRENNDKELINATLQLQYAVNSMATATKNDTNYTETFKGDAASDIFAAFAAGLDDVSEGQSLGDSISEIIAKAPIDKLSSNASAVKEIAKISAKNINLLLDDDALDASLDIQTMNEILTKAVVLQEKTISKLEDINFTDEDFVIDETMLDIFEVTSSEMSEINFDEEAVKIYFKDSNIEMGDDFNASEYVDKISFGFDNEDMKAEIEKDIEEKQKIADETKQKVLDNNAAQEVIEDATEAQKVLDDEAEQKIIDDAITAQKSLDDSRNIGNIINNNIFADKMNKTDAQDEMRKEIANAQLDSLKTDVIPMFAPSKVATVIDSKTLIANVRETTFSLVNEDEDEKNTIFNEEAIVLEENIEPVTDELVTSFEDSTTKIKESLDTFDASLDKNFEVIDEIKDRLNALIDQTEEFEDEDDWSVRADTDTLSHTYTEDNITNIYTEVFTFNGQSLTFKYEKVIDTEDENDTDIELVTLSTTGVISLKEDGKYDLNIHSILIGTEKSIIKASGTIEGINGSSMNLKTLSIALDFDKTKRADNPFSNLELEFDGTIISSGRQLDGKLILSEQDTSILTGYYEDFTDTENKLTLDGIVTLRTSIDALVADERTNDETKNDFDTDGYIDYHGLVMMTFKDGTQSLLDNYVHDYTNNSYTLTAQNGNSLECTINITHLENSYSHNVECTEGTLQSYYPINDNEKVVVTIAGNEYGVYSIYSDYHNETEYDDKDEYIGYKEIVTSKFYLDNPSESSIVTDIRVEKREEIELADREFDLELYGKITHNEKVIEATVSIDNDLKETFITAKNITITDTTNNVSLGELTLVLPSSDFVENMKDDDDWRYSNKSTFESYTVYYDEDNEDDNDDIQDKLTKVDLNNLSIAIKDVNGDMLDFNADIDYIVEDGLKTVNFNGEYTYKKSKFIGIISASGYLDDNIETEGTFAISGIIEANEFAPFEFITAGTKGKNDEVDAYALLKKGLNYSLGIHILNEYNATDLSNSMEVNIADSNGVLSTYTKIEKNDGSDTQDFSINFTDKNDKSLAEYGESANGNIWEVKYSDDSSETLF